MLLSGCNNENVNNQENGQREAPLGEISSYLFAIIEPEGAVTVSKPSIISSNYYVEIHNNTDDEVTFQITVLNRDDVGHSKPSERIEEFKVGPHSRRRYDGVSKFQPTYTTLPKGPPVGRAVVRFTVLVKDSAADGKYAAQLDATKEIMVEAK